MVSGNLQRPFEAEALAGLLKDLATVTAIASGMGSSLEPLSADDTAAGAEPLSREQIREDLERISRIVTAVALERLGATPEEWYSAAEAVE